MEICDQYWMKRALFQASSAFAQGEVPIGAVLVMGENCLAEFGNAVEKTQRASAHAEMLCLEHAASNLKTWRLAEATLYTTVEPCAMCWGAMHLYRIKRCVYGTKDKRHGFLNGICGHNAQENFPKYPNHCVILHEGVLELESKVLLQAFFRLRRKENRERKDV